MKQYIDKSALVAEIESKRKYAQTLGDNAINSSMQQFYDGMKQGCVDILQFIDTLEVKEEYIENDFGSFWGDYIDSGGDINNYEVAKHFFELGLKAQKGEIV